VEKPLVVLAILIAGLVLSGLGDAAISFADTDTFSNEVTSATSNSSTSDEILGLRIDNINKNGADFHWSTSVATNGSVEYAYTKLAQISGSQQSVAISVLIKRVESDPHYRQEHHIRVDNLDMYYHPFVEYTIKSETRGGEVYTLSGEFVLVDTQVLHRWQSPYLVIPLAVIAVAGFILTIRNQIQSRKAKRGVAPQN